MNTHNSTYIAGTRRTDRYRAEGTVDRHSANGRPDPSGGPESSWISKTSDFLAAIGEDDAKALLTLARRRSYKKGQRIFEAGDPPTAAYIVENGRVKIFQVSASGKEIILWHRFPGELFGMAELASGGKRLICAQASTDSEIFSVSRNSFLQFLADRPMAAMTAIEMLSGRMRRLSHALMSVSTEDVVARLVRLLIDFAQCYGQSHCNGPLATTEICLNLPLTRQEVADMIGTSRQTATSLLSDLKRRGALHWKGRHIHIDSMDILVSELPHGHL